jgi:hypothetical protein
MKRVTGFAALVVLLSVVPCGPPAAAQDWLPTGTQVSSVSVPQAPSLAAPARGSLSAAPAASLVGLLERLKMDAIVARDPEEPGRYVAALYIPGSQLLVVSAPYPVPAALDKKLLQGLYMDAYQDIQAVRNHQGHFFVVDMLADGLTRISEPDQPFDSTTIDGGSSVTFDGKWEGQQLTEAAYSARFAQDDERYARMLTILRTALARRTT